MQGGAARASRQGTAKPDAFKGPLRRCGGCAGKVAGLIRGGLRGCPVMHDHRDRRVGKDGSAHKSVARRGEVSRGRSTGGDRKLRREGPNAEPRRSLLVLVGVAMSAANPCGGLGGRAGG